MLSTTISGGRTSDLSSLQSFEGFKVTRMSTDAAKDGVPNRVCGLQKLIQRYATIFLTPSGSVPTAAKYGSGMVPAATRGFLVDRSSVLKYFALANMDATRQLRAESSDALFGAQALDERLSKAALEDYAVDLQAAKLYLKVRIESLAGESAVFILPAK
jgi:hypothetical protein